MKEFVIYESAKKGREWVDVVVISRVSFMDAEDRFFKRVEEDGFLEVSGVNGCVRKNGKVTAWYKYDHSISRWTESRKPLGWERWESIIES